MLVSCLQHLGPCRQFQTGGCIGHDGIQDYVVFYNFQRPSLVIGYDTSDNYYRMFMEGGIEHRETFGKRILSKIQKGCRKTRKSTLGNENHPNQSVESTFLDRYPQVPFLWKTGQK